MKITLKQLVVFDAVARLGFVNQAAAEICLSQSATSMALQDLEKNLGVQLFHRHKKQLTLNENGIRLQPLVRSLITQAQEIERNADTIEGRLNIGASTTIGQYILPPICAGFLAENPGVNIRMEVSPSGDLISQVDDMVLDLGFIETTCNRQSLMSTKIGEDRLHIVVSPDHRLAKKKRVTLDDLKQESWFLQSVPSATRTALTMGLSDKVGPLNVVFETNNLKAIREAVKTGAGIGCLSILAIQSDVASGTLVSFPLKELDLVRSLNVIYRADVYHGSLQKSFLDYIQRRIAERITPS